MWLLTLGGFVLVAALVALLLRMRSRRRSARRAVEVAVYDGDRLVGRDENLAGGTYNFVTVGLARDGLPELEISQAPIAWMKEVYQALRTMATVARAHKPLDGEELSVHLRGVTLAARCRAATRAGQPVFRLEDIDPDGEGRLPLLALSTLLLMLARTAEENEDDAAGSPETFLERAIELYPGDPKRRAYRFAGRRVNQENYLVYLAMANRSGADGKWYRMALERSDILEQQELGARVLPELPRETLEHDALCIVCGIQEDVNATQILGHEFGEGGAKGAALMALLPSPIPKPDGKLAVMPNIGSFQRYYYNGPVAERLRSKDVVSLAAEVYAAYQQRPLDFLDLVRDTRAFYEGREVEDPDPEPVTADGYEPHYRMLGSVLADIGRNLAAGLTLDELREHYGLTATGPLASSIKAKLDALEAEEARLMLGSMGLA